MRSVLITGSRDWEDTATVEETLEREAKRGDFRLIEGGARGADSIAHVWAVRNGVPVETVPARWDLHGRRAGVLRNQQMLDFGPERVLAFQRNGSRGTQDMIERARRKGTPVALFVASGGEGRHR